MRGQKQIPRPKINKNIRALCLVSLFESFPTRLPAWTHKAANMNGRAIPGAYLFRLYVCDKEMS